MAKKPPKDEQKVSTEEMTALSEAYESAEQSPAEGSGGVRSYDFFSPDKFSKDHLRTLNALHADFAAGLSGVLSGVCQLQTRVSVTNVDQVSYKGYRTSLPVKTLFAEVSAEPLSRYIIIEVNPSVVGMWVDYLCGGNPQLPAEPSDLTPIDCTVAERVLTSCLQVYADCWSSVVRFKPEIRRVVGSDSYEETLAGSEAVLVCSFEVDTGDPIGSMTICMPATSLEPMLPLLSTYGLGRSSNKGQNKTSDEDVKRLLESVEIPCRVVLGSTKVSLTDAVDLKVGDVVKTGRSVDADLEMYVGNVPLYKCRPGVRGRDISVMISDALTPSEATGPATPSPEPPSQEIEQEAPPEAETQLAA